jgi:aryl-alcohol dehydrogenase-like predicted oxidoreductase
MKRRIGTPKHSTLRVSRHVGCEDVPKWRRAVTSARSFEGRCRVETGTIGSLHLSLVGLGGYEFEDDPGWPGARDVLEGAIEAGINWLDTSEAYFAGKNEETIGAALRDVGGQMLMISTKVAPTPSGTGFEPDQIRLACTNSLERLGVDRLDMYLLHFPDDTGVTLEDTWATMRSLVDQGLVRLVGLSNFNRDQIERCLAVGLVDLIQDGLCPIDHLENLDLFRWCDERSIGVVTYEPLGNGMLAGVIHAPEDFVRVVGDAYEEWPFWQRLFSPGKFVRSQAVADGMLAVADRLGCTLAQVALAWNVHQEGVTATLAGSRNPTHVLENAGAASILLTEEQMAELDALIPLGPTFA